MKFLKKFGEIKKNKLEKLKKVKRRKRVKLFFHILGFSSIGGAIFLQILVFMDILRQGYFKAVENNLAILTFEAFMTFFATMYFAYIYRKFLQSTRIIKNSRHLSKKL